MNLTLFIQPDCPACDRVLRGLQKSAIPVEIIEKSKAEGPFLGKIMAVPALFRDQELIAYGDDILTRATRI